MVSGDVRLPKPGPNTAKAQFICQTREARWYEIHQNRLGGTSIDIGTFHKVTLPWD